MTPTPQPIRHFFTKVVGVTHRNDDGTKRQKIIKRCRRREPVQLIHDVQNQYDPNAIMVCRVAGKQLGFLNAELAETVVQSAAKEQRYSAFVAAVTGGGWGQSYGMNLLILVADPATRQQDLLNEAKRVLEQEGP